MQHADSRVDTDPAIACELAVARTLLSLVEHALDAQDVREAADLAAQLAAGLQRAQAERNVLSPVPPARVAPFKENTSCRTSKSGRTSSRLPSLAPVVTGTPRA